MPTAEVREFSSLLGDGASTHGRRPALPAAHRGRIVARMSELALTDPELRRSRAGWR